MPVVKMNPMESEISKVSVVISTCFYRFLTYSEILAAVATPLNKEEDLPFYFLVSTPVLVPINVDSKRSTFFRTLSKVSFRLTQFS